MKGEKMGSSPYFNKNVSYQTSSIPITEVTQKKSRIIAAEAVTLSKTNNETTNEAINGTTDETLKNRKIIHLIIRHSKLIFLILI